MVRFLPCSKHIDDSDGLCSIGPCTIVQQWFGPGPEIVGHAMERVVFGVKNKTINSFVGLRRRQILCYSTRNELAPVITRHPSNDIERDIEVVQRPLGHLPEDIRVACDVGRYVAQELQFGLDFPVFSRKKMVENRAVRSRWQNQRIREAIERVECILDFRLCTRNDRAIKWNSIP